MSDEKAELIQALARILLRCGDLHGDLHEYQIEDATAPHHVPDCAYCKIKLWLAKQEAAR